MRADTQAQRAPGSHAGVAEASAPADDCELMERYRDGDASAFETLYRRHGGPLYRFCLRHSGDAARAADLFQDIWRRLIDHRRRYRPRARFTTYLYSIAHSCIIDRHRRARRQPVDLAVDDAQRIDRLSDPALDPDRAAQRAWLAARLAAALRDLPAEQREAFLLREECGFSLHEIAAATGVGAETAKSRLRYAVRKLRRALDGERAQLISEAP